MQLQELTNQCIYKQNIFFMKRFFYLLLLTIIPFAANAQRWSKSLEKEAKKGDVTAQLEVAHAYFKGNGIEKNLEKLLEDIVPPKGRI